MNGVDYDKTTISVIIPAYNVEKWIQECVYSVVMQTRPFDDVIVLDDGSTDGTYELCKEYSYSYYNIRLFRHPNMGLGATRNVGISELKTDYFIFLDSDDKLELNACELLHDMVKKYPVDILYYNATSFGDQFFFDCKDSYYREGTYSGKVLKGSRLFEQMYPIDYRPSACLAIYRTEFIRKNGITFPEGIYYEDNLYSFKCMQIAEKVMHQPFVLYDRRYRGGSITTSRFSLKHMTSQIENTKLTLQYVFDFMDEDRSAVLYSFRLFQITYDAYVMFLTNNPDDRTDVKERFKEIVIQLEYIFRRNSIICLSIESDEVLRICIFMIIQIIRIVDFHFFSKHIEKKYENVLKWGSSIYSVFFDQSMLRDSTKCVGIYGIGKCTHDMLSAYEKIYGELKAKIIFIASDAVGKKYRNNKVYSLDQVSTLLDCIIISSSKYHNSIAEAIKSFNLRIPIVDPYEKIEIPYFSYVGEYDESVL